MRGSIRGWGAGSVGVGSKEQGCDEGLLKLKKSRLEVNIAGFTKSTSQNAFITFMFVVVLVAWVVLIK